MYLAPFLGECEKLRAIMLKYKNKLKYFVHSNTKDERTIIMVATLDIPIFNIRKSIYVKDIQIKENKFLIYCELPEYVNVEAFLDSRYGEICDLVSKMFFHSHEAIDVMVRHPELKTALVNSFIVDERTRDLEFSVLYDMIVELDSILIKTLEYYD